MPAHILSAVGGRHPSLFRGSTSPSAIWRPSWGHKMCLDRHPSTAADDHRLDHRRAPRAREPCAPGPALRSALEPAHRSEISDAGRGANEPHKDCILEPASSAVSGFATFAFESSCVQTALTGSLSRWCGRLLIEMERRTPAALRMAPPTLRREWVYRTC